MISSAIIPRPLAKLPWRLIFLVTGIGAFAFLVLYSAAGGSIRPWAFKQRHLHVLPDRRDRQVVAHRIDDQEAGVPRLCVMCSCSSGSKCSACQEGRATRLDLGPTASSRPSREIEAGDRAHSGAILRACGRPRTRANGGHFWPAALMLGVPAVLILLQPDLGTTIMVVLCGVTVMFLAGVPMWVFIAPIVAIAVAAPIVYQSLHGYQKKRIDTFLDPESDPLGTGYHIAQSKIAIGSGGVWGKGFLNGSQSHLDYLPEGHTDFVFATMTEEWGLAGGVLLILAFAAVIRWGLKVGSKPAPLRAIVRLGARSHDLFLRLRSTDDGLGLARWSAFRFRWSASAARRLMTGDAVPRLRWRSAAAETREDI